MSRGQMQAKPLGVSVGRPRYAIYLLAFFYTAASVTTANDWFHIWFGHSTPRAIGTPAMINDSFASPPGTRWRFFYWCLLTPIER